MAIGSSLKVEASSQMTTWACGFRKARLAISEFWSCDRLSGMRLAALLLLLCIGLYAQLLIVSPADITGTSTAVQIGSSGVARWIQIKSAETNATTNCSASVTTGCVHVGDSNVSSTRGLVLPPGGSMFFPFAQGAPGYDLTKTYVYAVTGEKVQILWAK